MLCARIVWVLGVLAGTTTQAAVGQAAPVGATLIGRVLGQDGEPLRAAVVWLTDWSDDARVLQRVRTDGEGVFLCNRVPGSRCRVHARGVGTTTATADVTGLRRGRAASAELRVWDARTLRGRIVDEQGVAIAGASLVATKDFTSPTLRVDGTTARDGTFELAGVPIGDVVVRALAPGFGYQERAFHDWIDERGDLVMKRDGERLEIRVVGLPQTAIGAANLRLEAMPLRAFALPRAIEEARLGADGVCRLEGLPLAEWSVAIGHPEYEFLTPVMRVPRGPAPQPVHFQAAPIAEVAVTGRATIGTEPLAWHELLLHGGPSKSATPLVSFTDDDGWFEFRTPLRARTGMLLELDDERLVFAQEKVPGTRGAYDLGHAALHEERIASDCEVQLVAEPAMFVRGRVVGSGAVANVPVELQQQRLARTGEMWITFARTVSDARGMFAIGGLRASETPVRLRAGGATASGSTGAFRIGDAVPDLRIGVPARIEGRLVDADGEPRSGVRVSLDSTRQALMPAECEVFTDYEGRFVFVGVDAGTHQLGHWRRGDLVTVDPVEALAGQTERVEIVVDAR